MSWPQAAINNWAGTPRRPSGGRLNLKPDELVWVQAKWLLIRDAQTKADAANNNWTRINDEIKDYMDRKGINEYLQRARVKSESLPLRDAFMVGQWHAANAQRHIDDLGLFLRMKELELL